MKYTIFFFCLLSGFSSFAQESINVNGIYSSKSNSRLTPMIDEFTYFRFYPNGTLVALVSNSANTDSVAGILGRNASYDHLGSYKVNGDDLQIFLTSSTDNNGQPLQRPKVFEGRLEDAATVCLLPLEDGSNLCFRFLAANEPN